MDLILDRGSDSRTSFCEYGSVSFKSCCVIPAPVSYSRLDSFLASLFPYSENSCLSLWRNFVLLFSNFFALPVCFVRLLSMLEIRLALLTKKLGLVSMLFLTDPCFGLLSPSRWFWSIFSFLAIKFWTTWLLPAWTARLYWLKSSSNVSSLDADFLPDLHPLSNGDFMAIMFDVDLRPALRAALVWS